MFLSNAMMDWAGPRDPHPGLPGLWGGNMGHYYDEQMYSVFWGWGRERFISCGQVFWSGERDWAFLRTGDWVHFLRTGLRWVASLPRGAIVMSGPGLMQGPMSRFMALIQPLSLLIPEAPDTTKGREGKAVQSWSCPLLAVTLGRAGLVSHQLKH